MSHACHRFWKRCKTLTFCSLSTRCAIPCACHAKRALNVQKWSEAGVFCTFWLRNVFRATTACNFSSLIWPDGSAPAALASLLFDPPEPQITGKTQWFATFYLFAHLHLLSSDSFSPLIFFLLFFSFLTLFTSAFSFVHIAGSLTSKLPSDILMSLLRYDQKTCNDRQLLVSDDTCNYQIINSKCRIA